MRIRSQIEELTSKLKLMPNDEEDITFDANNDMEFAVENTSEQLELLRQQVKLVTWRNVCMFCIGNTD